MYTTMPLRQFRRRFRTERDCLRYLSKHKWRDGFRWPRCNHDQAYLISSRRKYQCKGCNHQTSLTAHTICHKTRKPVRDWLRAIFLVATRTTGSSARQLQYDLGISYPTAWRWCHKIRQATHDRDTRYTFQGVGELDDTYIGGKWKRGKRGRGARSKVPVLVAVESRPQGCAHVALSKLESLISRWAKTFLHQKVQLQAFMLSDSLPIYRSLSGDLNLYPVSVSSGQRAVEILPDVDRVIARLKSWIRGTHSHVSSKHLNRYLAEFSYRFNPRFKTRRARMFDRLVKACCTTQTITYQELVSALN